MIRRFLGMCLILLASCAFEGLEETNQVNPIIEEDPESMPYIPGQGNDHFGDCEGGFIVAVLPDGQTISIRVPALCAPIDIYMGRPPPELNIIEKRIREPMDIPVDNPATF